MPAESTQEAHAALLRHLTANPPKTKDEAEVAKITAEAIASLVASDGAREEMLDAKSKDSIKRKRLEYWMNRMGITVSLVGIAGTIGFGIDTLRTNADLKVKEAQLVDIEKRELEAKRAIEVADRYQKAIEIESKQANTATETAVKAAAEAGEKKKDAETAATTANRKRAEADEKVATAVEATKIAEQNLQELEIRIKERLALTEKSKDDESRLRDALAGLPENVKVAIRNRTEDTNPIIAAIGVKEAPVAETLVSDAEVSRLMPRVMDLFSPELSPITSKCTTCDHFKVHHFGWVFSDGGVGVWQGANGFCGKLLM